MNTSILLPVQTDQSESCPNSWVDSGEALNRFLRNANKFRSSVQTSPPAGFTSSKDHLVTLIYAFFRGMGLQRCESPVCKRLRDVYEQVIPPCRWEHLREYIAVWSSCWKRAAQEWAMSLLTDRKSARGRGHGIEGPPFSVDLSFLVYNIADKGDSSPEDTEIINEILAVVDWLSFWADHEGRWHTDIRDMDLSATAGTLKDLQRRECIRSARNPMCASILKRLGICPSRLWNLVVGRSNDFDYMLLILDHLSEHEQQFRIARPSHDECTEELCIRAFDSTTTTQQLHKCLGGGCGTFEFPMKKLDEAFRPLSTPTPWIPSAWDVSIWGPGAKPHLLDEGRRFIAISHVWSDGTGNGVNKQGVVNACLIEYWVSIAKSLKCDGLWWDTICVPMEKQSRRKALNIMLENFSRATYVVVHDQELVNMPWTDGPNAAVAVLVSSWFTRGWTAAEFYSTRKKRNSVKILFKNPDDTLKPLVKDLDRDILSRPQQATTLVHFKASTILRSVRGDITDLRGLLQVLRTRSTSWDRDKMTIAGLMTLDQRTVDTSLSTPALTRSILLELLTVPKTSIFHNKVPMALEGGWSWCPPSIFDFDVSTLSGVRPDTAGGRQEPLLIEKDGSIGGTFTAYPVQLAYRDKVYPYSSHPSLSYRILKALESPETCLILEIGGATTESAVTSGILVEPVVRHGKFVDCRYIGCVHVSFPAALRSSVIKCTIGWNDRDKDNVPRPSIDAQDIFAKADGKIQSGELDAVGS
ncbi:hypothetical protein F4776DRAFT_511756 [Hypoxylon sp. NC0597]|nr:hypothetical protein F4776DRAFT_511756 [Hypoxylon sp. NC0597]